MDRARPHCLLLVFLPFPQDSRQLAPAQSPERIHRVRSSPGRSGFDGDKFLALFADCVTVRRLSMVLGERTLKGLIGRNDRTVNDFDSLGRSRGLIVGRAASLPVRLVSWRESKWQASTSPYGKPPHPRPLPAMGGGGTMNGASCLLSSLCSHFSKISITYARNNSPCTAPRRTLVRALEKVSIVTTRVNTSRTALAGSRPRTTV